MPNPECITCNIKESLLWRIRESGYLCNDCYKIETENSSTVKTEQEPAVVEKKPQIVTEGTTATTPAPTPTTKTYKKGGKRWTRSRAGANNTNATPGSAGTQRGTNNPRGRGRRGNSKKIPYKAPPAITTVIQSETIYYDGKFMQIGDIVSMLDEEGDTYYAQIRGFLVDQYCEKSAVVTWLLPTKSSPPPSECFHPSTYIIGPEEDLPRKLSCMKFVMHAPSEYYKANNSPYLPVEVQSIPKVTNDFIWSNLEPKHR